MYYHSLFIHSPTKRHPGCLQGLVTEQSNCKHLPLCGHKFSTHLNMYVYVDISCARLFATPWTVIHQTSLSMEFSGQGYWSGQLFPSPGDLPNPGIEPRSPALQADSLPSEPPGEPIFIHVNKLMVYEK